MKNSRIADFVLSTIIVLGFSKISQTSQNDLLIVGGKDAISGEFPWMVSLQLLFEEDGPWRSDCGGSILNSTHVITAAHCVEDYTIEHEFTVVTGALNVTNNFESTQKRFYLTEIRKHADFVGGFIDRQNDIALLELEHPIEFNSHAQPIPICTEEPQSGNSVINTGWGNVIPGDEDPFLKLPDILQKVTIQIVDREICKLSYPGSVLGNKILCATGKDENGGPLSGCVGDSGGPLIYKPHNSDNYCLAGITSWGKSPCGSAPGIYTSATAFLDWI